MIIPMLCVTIFVILVVWFLLPRVARLMIHTPTAISIFVCLSMVQLMAVFISMRCTLCGHFLQVALTLILVVGYAIAAKIRVNATCRKCLHFHAVHFMRTLPTGSVDPNFGRRVRNRRQLNSLQNTRSEERRVGKECRSRWTADHKKKKEGAIQLSYMIHRLT